MSNLVSKCGIDCSTCPWGPYPRKGMSTECFEGYRTNVKRILGYMPIRTPCLTCKTPDEKIPKESRLPNRKCLIRQCVDKTGVENCAYCSRFPCDTVKATGGAWNRKVIEEKLGAPLSEEEYLSFVKPFEGISRLEAIRASLKTEEIVDPVTIPTNAPRMADFPESLPFSSEEVIAFKAVYGLLSTLLRSSLGLRDTDTFGQYYKLEDRRIHVLRFLWILGNYGKFEKNRNDYLVIDPVAFLDSRGSEKTLAIWSYLKDVVFKVLSEFAVSCERITLKGFNEKDLATGTGYLRSKGWVIKMSFEEKIGGAAVLRALGTYVRRLDKKFNRKGFQHFQEADMTILLDT